MGNDYIPKFPGAKLPLLWGTLTQLLHGGEFRGQHLLLPSEGRVEINMRLLIALTRHSCIRITEASTLESEKDGDYSENHESEIENEPDDVRHGCNVGLDNACGVDVESYLHTLAWCAYMYLSGSCPDYSIIYYSRKAPTADHLDAFAAKKQKENGKACHPSYATPSQHGSFVSAPLSPDVFCMCLLPAAGAPYLPRPLQAIMLDQSHPLAECFHANKIWPYNLVNRV